jgi:antirestriction protein ArdC
MNVPELITKIIIEKLKQGVVSWQKPWKGEMPKNLISKKTYKGINLFLLNMMPFSSSYWLTAKQAKDLGGQIMKSEWKKYTPVLYWNWLDVENDDGEEKTIPFMRFYQVYNLDQTVAIPKPKEETTQNNFTPIQTCENIIKKMQDKPTIKHGVAKAYYDSNSDLINLPNKELFVSNEAFYGVLFHELTHSTGHPSRLNRKTLTEATYFGSTNYSKEELIAEMGASFLCGNTGIENKTIDNSAAYIGGWLKRLKDDSRLVIISAANAQKAVNWILS